MNALHVLHGDDLLTAHGYQKQFRAAAVFMVQVQTVNILVSNL